MRVYWSLKSVPELSALTGKQRRRIHHQCLRRHFWFAPATRRSVAAFLSSIFATSAVVSGGVGILFALGYTNNFWAVGVLGYIGWTCGMFVSSRIAIPALRPFYRAFIERDARPDGTSTAPDVPTARG